MRLNINELKYIIKESTAILLNEISNNAIETMIKQSMPEITNLMNISAFKVFYENPEMRYRLGINRLVVDDNPEMKLKDYLRLKLQAEFGINHGNGPQEFLRGIVRLCCSNEIHYFDRERKWKGNVLLLKKIVDYLHTHQIQMDEDLGGMTLDELEKMFGEQMRKHDLQVWIDSNAEEQVIKNYGDYTVIKIHSFEDAHKYEPYTTWCVTQRQSYYDTYAGDGSQFFFCLKSGFENVPREIGENCPLDEYGLSMVSVCIKPNGEPKCITTRWNHDNTGENNSNLKRLDQVEAKLGIPRTEFTMGLQRPQITLEDIEYLLSLSHIRPESIFDEYHHVNSSKNIIVVRVGNKFNLLQDRKILSDIWFDKIKYDRIVNENEPYLPAFLNEQGWTCLNEKGEIVLKNFIPYQIESFNGRIGGVRFFSGEKVFNANGELVSDETFHSTGRSVGDKIIVCGGDGYNYEFNIMNSNGEKMFPDWCRIVSADTNACVFEIKDGRKFHINIINFECYEI